MKRMTLIAVCLLSAILNFQSSTNAAEQLRRPISEQQPAWIIHIDVWNYADPQKIIDMVPDDIRPFVIFNIATSSSDDKQPNGPDIYDSWMKVCAQNRVWTMIQCSSGAVNRMPDDGSTEAYEQYFKDYPNFLGFNFAEQFWGFSSDGHVTFAQRLQLFADLMPICHAYGGYLAVSFTDSYYSSSKMPLAWMKRNAQLRAFLEEDATHFLCFEKFTLKKNFLDIESNCLGAWIGGYAGQYGIRFDSSGWLTGNDETDQTRGADDFVRAAGAIPLAEHVMLNGVSIMDGPELTWTECSQEAATTVNADGYTQRNWKWFSQFENISLDLFRKMLDGTMRIPSKSEVINRTKVCIVNDINKNLDNEDEHDSYVTPEQLFDGLYRSAADQGGAPNHWIANRWWMKSTGRYPAIPQVLTEVEGMTCFKKSQYNKAAFDAWMNETFAQEYTGDIFAGHVENGWVTYNPYQYDETMADGYRVCSASTQRATGTIPFQYNTCECMTLDYAPYSLGIIKEYADHLTLYLNNYQTTGTMSEDVITVYGASSLPTVTWTDRSNHAESIVSTVWTDGILTIKVKHNGPLDMTINCKGFAADRLTAPQHTVPTAPAMPPAYTGILQYEAELADYKNASIRKTGYNQGHDGYWGQGFAELKSTNSALRFAVKVPQTGYYLLSLRYQADDDGIMTAADETLALSQSDTWATATAIVLLNEGDNNIVLLNKSGKSTYIDCMILESIKAAVFTPDESGEYHVDQNDLMASGTISFDPATGVVTQSAGSQNDSGSLRLFFDYADFTHVTSLMVSYEGDGDIFKYLLISDNQGNTANPTGTQGAFWSSKYNLNYADYQQTEASLAVCKLEWTANAPKTVPRTMTITDIVIKSQTTDINSIDQQATAPVGYYTLQGQRVDYPGKGIYIVSYSNGQVIKKICK